jgi:ferredoxin
VDANSCQTAVPKVFAAGSCVRSVKQLVRAMADGRAAADCVHKFVLGQAPKRPEKTFSSIMGRLSPGELRQFLISTHAGGSVQPCDRCAGHNRKEAALESARCLHCDCRSSGNCVLQHYAQAYSVDANHYRSERREFTQVSQPAGVIFEQGKCILCGICVKLTELAREPLGLTFIGRGFDVKVAAPFDAAIQEGMKTVAAECVKHCPTGALTFEDRVEVPVPALETQSNPVEAP